MVQTQMRTGVHDSETEEEVVKNNQRTRTYFDQTQLCPIQTSLKRILVLGQFRAGSSGLLFHKQIHYRTTS